MNTTATEKPLTEVQESPPTLSESRSTFQSEVLVVGIEAIPVARIAVSEWVSEHFTALITTTTHQQASTPFQL